MMGTSLDQMNSPGLAVPPCDIFLRIPKTASFTLRNLVTREYGRESCLDTDFPFLDAEGWRDFSEKVAAMPAVRRARYRAIVGHMKFGAHSLMPGPSRYITFLRHPVKRFASYYYMVRHLGLVPPDHRLDP